MSWSRDFFEEVRKFDPSVAAHIDGLGFSASEKMLIGTIIFFTSYVNAESIKSFRYLINPRSRPNKDERFRIFILLTNPPNDVIADICLQDHEDRTKKLLEIVCAKFGTTSGSYKRVLAVRFILRNLNRGVLG